MTLYSAPTPNGLKISLMLEECGLTYESVLVDLAKKEQKTEKILALNPNGKIPILVDGQLTVFESGAILQYLAEKTNRFLATETKEKYLTLQWLFWQMAQLGPNLGGYFSAKMLVRPRVQPVMDRYHQECLRVLDVLDQRFSQSEYLASAYSIADMACLPWIQSFVRIEPEWISSRPYLAGWLQRCGQRPAVQKVFSGR